jgi:hypothetical protein
MELDICQLIAALFISTLGLWLTFPVGHYTVCNISPEKCSISFYTFENFLFGYLTIISISTFAIAAGKTIFTFCVCTGVCMAACSGNCGNMNMDEKITIISDKN